MPTILRLASLTIVTAAFLCIPSLAITKSALAGQTDPASDRAIDFSARKDGQGGGGMGGGGGRGGGGRGGGGGGGGMGGGGGGRQMQQPRIQQPRVQQRQQQRVLRQQQRGQRQDLNRAQRQQRQQQQRGHQQQRQQQQRVQQQQRKEQQRDRQKAQQQQRQERQQLQRDRQKTQRQERQQQQRDRQKALQQDRQQQRQDRQQQQRDRKQTDRQQRQDRQQQRKQDSQQRQRDRQAQQRDRQQRKIQERAQRDKARQDRQRQRAERDQTRRIADTRRSKDRAEHRMKNRFSRDAARQGRFAARFRNRDFARVRFARWAPERAWRRGLLAGFVPWGIGLGIGGAVFWPYAYADLFNYTFWPTGYYGGYWAYAYDDLFDGIWWDEEPAYVTEDLAYQPAPSGGGAPAAVPVRPQTQSRVQDQVQDRTAPGRRTEATAGEGACGETGRGITAWPFDRIQSSLNLSADQQDLLDALRDAALQAAETMRDSCPRSVPRNPVERLQTMLERIEATLDALKIVRPALESFYDSLSPDQQRRFEALGPKIASAQMQGRAGADDANACGTDKPGLANFPIAKIQEAVSPTDDQLDLLDALEDATFKALDILKAACPLDPPVSPSERLAATQTRIEAMIEAAKAIQPALEDFYAALDDQQKARFGKMKS